MFDEWRTVLTSRWINGYGAIMMNYKLIVLGQTNVKFNPIEQAHRVNKAFERVLWSLLIHRLQAVQIIVVLEVQCQGIVLNSEQVVSSGINL